MIHEKDKKSSPQHSESTPSAPIVKQLNNGADRGPLTNRGGTDDDGTEFLTIRPRGNKTQIVRIPKPEISVSPRVGFVDQISFTVRVPDVLNRELSPPYSSTFLKFNPSDAVERLSSILLLIFGFSVVAQRDRGLNFYAESYELTDGAGILSIGGQNDTVNVQIYGNGCQNAKIGWENRLKYYLESVSGWITRIDIAADFYDGSYSVDQAESDYLSGKMSLTNRVPYAERRGDWYTGLGGRTFYVGRRKSGKLLRVYEKGLQLLGTLASSQVSENSKLSHLLDWVRVEVEWHNQDRICPLDMLTNPGNYLAGSYPAFNDLTVEQDKVKTTKNTAKLTVEQAKEWLKHSAGKHIKTLVDLFGVDDFIDFVTEGKDYARYVTTFGGFSSLNEPLPLYSSALT